MSWENSATEYESVLIIDGKKFARRPLVIDVEKIARAAWSVLNFDNDFDGTEEWNKANRENLITAIREAVGGK